jgi:hypothetical protein
MNIEHQYNGDCISIITAYEKVEEITLIERFFLKVLKASFLDQNIKVVTKGPQKYSLGYELGSHSKIDVGKTEVLINDVTKCGLNLLEDINQSEEFKRGLLILIKGYSNSIEDTMLAVLKIQKGIHAELKDTVVFCEDDGAGLLLYNSALTIEFLEYLEGDI